MGTDKILLGSLLQLLLSVSTSSGICNELVGHVPVLTGDLTRRQSVGQDLIDIHAGPNSPERLCRRKWLKVGMFDRSFVVG